MYYILVAVFSLIYGGNLLGTSTIESPLSLSQEIEQDTSRLSELDQYWNALSTTVNAGNFEGYAALYHPDAVVIFATGENKVSIPISKALDGWQKGFQETKDGKNSSSVEFRFSQRINDETTAHETGIFHYTSKDKDGKMIADSYVHFEMLMVKRNDKWDGLMEYQKSFASKEDWEALK